MNRLDLHHAAITPKILRTIFAKTTKLSVTRLAQTGRLGRDILISTRPEIIESFQRVQEFQLKHRWLPRTLLASRKEQARLDDEYFARDCFLQLWDSKVLYHRSLIHTHIANIIACTDE